MHDSHNFNFLMFKNCFFSPKPQDPNLEEYGDYNYGSYGDYGEDYYGGGEGNYGSNFIIIETVKGESNRFLELSQNLHFYDGFFDPIN